MGIILKFSIKSLTVLKNVLSLLHKFCFSIKMNIRLSIFLFVSLVFSLQLGSGKYLLVEVQRNEGPKITCDKTTFISCNDKYDQKFHYCELFTDTDAQKNDCISEFVCDITPECYRCGGQILKKNYEKYKISDGEILCLL